MAESNFLTDNYLKWIWPLLEYPDNEILLQHTKLSSSAVKLKDGKEDAKVLRKQYHLTVQQIRQIVRRLKKLTQLYELLVIAEITKPD